MAEMFVGVSIFTGLIKGETMPFKSKQQTKFLYSQHPEIAKEFASHTKSIKSLPKKVGMKELTTKKRNRLKKSTFALPGQRKYPINDLNHARNALARSSGKPEEATVKSAVYKKYPSLKNAGMSDKLITIFLADQLGIDPAKWYKALSSGVIHSRKYNGVWDSDPLIYRCELGEGEIEIHQNFLEAIYNNFRRNANETIPFIDIDHQVGISAGPILDCKLQDGSLWIKPDWNEVGKKAVGDKEYMYLSLGIESHKDSRTGNWIFPVMTTASLTNIPVDKNQDILELSEKSVPVGKKTVSKDNDKIKLQDGGKKMAVSLDALLESISSLQEQITAALEDDEQGIYKAAIGAAIDNLEVSCGLASEEEEAGEGTESEDMMDKNPDAKKQETIPAGQATATNTVPEKTQMSDFPEYIELSDKFKVLEDKYRKQEVQLKDAAFTQRYVNRKITPAQKASYFALYLKDEAEVTKILDGMPKLNLTEELGTSDDIGIEVVRSQADAKKLFDAKALELSDKQKIGAAAAADLLKKQEPELYNKAYPAPRI